MVGLVAIVMVSAGLAVTMRVMAASIEAGRTQPKMGHHTQASTTPESWAAMRIAMAEAMRSGATWYTGAVGLTLIVAAFSGSASRGAGFGAGALGVAAAPMVLGVIKASNLLIPNGSATS